MNVKKINKKNFLNTLKKMESAFSENEFVRGASLMNFLQKFVKSDDFNMFLDNCYGKWLEEWNLKDEDEVKDVFYHLNRYFDDPNESLSKELNSFYEWLEAQPV